MQQNWRYYEDLKIGDERLSTPHKVTSDEILEFARQYDPQWFHADEEKAKESTFGGLIASGIHTCALWRRMDHEINSDIANICGVGWDDVRWPAPVRPGDALRARSKVLDKRVSRSEADRGVVTVLYEVINQHDETVLSMKSINLIRRRPR